ncbi:hypothetical protein COU76_03760 [Candidatus Peregrinibacteria bacterium CG10_big_fil_rev_8_21_14_0_10_49_10]|nr:MAG: hypothetical protein COU76_03760 [Candidatus Peregrinibacteria bacterium CG10_big_fil_rev_8_21_14_0_10_49_10]
MTRRSHAHIACLVCVIGFFLPIVAHAAYTPLTYRYAHFLFEIDPDDHPAWHSTEERWTHNGQPFRAPAALRVDGDALSALPEGVGRTSVFAWDSGAIRATIDLQIAKLLDREPGSVIIRKDGDTVTFEGVGMLGRKVNVAEAAKLTVEALQRGISDITLPVSELQPQITIQDADLQDSGIQEVLAVGESDYRGSPQNRQHNIETGLSKFNGHIVPQGTVFSFDTVLGPVNQSTGYRKELVIQGDKTLPDYGGGLCQVSTTAYRGVWEYGFPIQDRVNHSYSVRYYFPQGTDATIYPPYKDVKFVNDSPGDLLIQTYSEDGRAYFIYYGTRDARETSVMGPYTWGTEAPPPDREERTTDIPPGTTRKVGERVPGVKAGWLRVIRNENDQETKEQYISVYEARPRFTQIGVTEEELNPPPTLPVSAPVVQQKEPAVQSWFGKLKRTRR